MPPEARLFLSIETSSSQCAVAIGDGERVFAMQCETMSKGHAERLVPMIETALAQAERSYADLDAIVVCTGPGNFTGIRIGVSAARGLAMGLNIPAIGVSSLQALAAPEGESTVQIDARLDRVYRQGFVDAIPKGEPEIAEGKASPALPDPARLIEIAARMLETDPPPAPPKPLYVRPADAAPSSEPPLVILDET